MRKRLVSCKIFLWDLRACAAVVMVGLGIATARHALLCSGLIMAGLTVLVLLVNMNRSWGMLGILTMADALAICVAGLDVGIWAALLITIPALTVLWCRVLPLEDPAERFYQKLKNLQDQLVVAERLAVIGQLSATVAHQVKSPLTSIALNLRLLQELIQNSPLKEDAQVASLLTLTEEAVDNLSEITRHYLQSGKPPPPRFVKGSVTDLLRNLAELIRPEAEGHGISVEIELPPCGLDISMDRTQLRLALTNLLRNAIEATAPGGKIHISCALSNEKAEIIIADTGKGMTESELLRAFQPFYTTKEGGSGLGLPVARYIVESHGGELSCKSQPGVGTSFRILLPLEWPDGCTGSPDS